MGIFSKAVIAALIGTVCGTAAGVWSLRQPTHADVSAPAADAATVATFSTDSTSNPSAATSLAAESASLAAEDATHVVQRARTLARRPDVTALIALREDVVRQAAERGIAQSAAVKGELDAIDSSLNEARLRQLKLDAQELRRAESR